MGKVTLDAETRAKLNGLSEQLELYDEAGTLVAVCLPPAVYRQLVGGDPSPFTDAEVRDAMNQTGGRPLAEILADLRRS